MVDARLEQLSLSPFSRTIDAEVLPPGFGLPKFNQYEPKTDAYTHLIYYLQIMSLYTSSDAVLCKVFPTSLGTQGSLWFNKLSPRSIRNFKDLE